MNKLEIAMRKTGRKLKKHEPAILTGIGIAGFLTTTVLAVKATPKALELINEAEELKGDKLTIPETVKASWKCYIPATVTGIASMACVIGSNSINMKRSAALAAAYRCSEEAYRVYRDKVVETIGTKKEQSVHDAIAQDDMKKNPVENKTVVITGNGTTLCYDEYSGRYFESDMETIRKIENDFNRRLMSENYISLNEFYYAIGLGNIPIGSDVGWSILNNDKVEIIFDSAIASNGKPCLVIRYLIQPRNDFRDLL